MGKEMYKIGGVAKAAGVNIQTIRYYEHVGLLTTPSRLPSGYRVYGDKDLQSLRFIKKAQALGFTLEEIKTLLKLKVSGPQECESVRRKTEEKIKMIEEKMIFLSQIKETLRDLVHCCEKRKKTGSCPILKSLDEGKI